MRTTGSSRPAQHITPTESVKALRQLYAEGKELLDNRPISEDKQNSWKLKARNYLEKAFGADSPNIDDVVSGGEGGMMYLDMSESDFEEERAEAMDTKLSNLNALIEMLADDPFLTQSADQVESSVASGTGVFLVHGHDNSALQTVARFLEKIGHPPTILHEQPNGGRTIIEKFEDHADVGYAVVLLTPDDKGGVHSAASDVLKPRARQNVIFELGYFIGRLGRKRVCALHVPNVETPSDYDGVLYISLDAADGWKLRLAKEMKSAGLVVDLNNAV